MSASEVELLQILLADDAVWSPQPGAQMEGFLTDAFELFYGGAAGGGKSDLLLGTAVNNHHWSLIFRREYPQLSALVERSREIIGLSGDYNEQKKRWRLDRGRFLEFGAVQYLKDIKAFQGRPHDFLGFDELPNFLEAQYRFLTGWVRTTVKGQRTRIINTGNPPTDSDGEWVLRRWGAWLDAQNAHPALPGQLRWYAVIDGKDTEVEDDTPIAWKRELLKPRSRTFIPARLDDNAYVEEDYVATLQALPEPLRSQLLYGDMEAGLDEDPYQVIPTAWVRLAMQRSKERGRPEGSLSALGVDVARGGKDQTTYAPRILYWYDPLKKYPGKQTPDGDSVSALAIAALDGDLDTPVNIDVVGVGASPYDSLKKKLRFVVGVNFGSGSDATDRSGKIRFANLRAELHWKFREKLDPVHGDGICLPDDPELLADLCAPRWELRSGRIYVESKDELRARLGRSTDSGDGVLLASYEDNAVSIMDFYRRLAEEQAKQNGTTNGNNS